MYKKLFKCIVDLFLSITIFIIILPFFLLVCIMLVITNRGYISFVQPRPGKDEKIFKLIKFKTMTGKKDKFSNLLPDKDRIMIIDTIIRKMSLDEIPQLLNIIKGDMSLIGPRPLLVEYATL